VTASRECEALTEKEVGLTVDLNIIKQEISSQVWNASEPIA